MKRAGIRSKYKPTSSKAPVEAGENVLEQDFTTETINQKWVADITYIHTLRYVWYYLVSVLDLHVGYKFGSRMTVDLVLDASTTP